MQQFSTSTDVTNTALTSQGSAMREQSEYAKSLESRLNRLSNSGVSLSESLGSALLTDSIVVFTETVADIADASSEVVSFVGLLAPTIGTLTTALALLSPRFRTAIADMVVFKGAAGGVTISTKAMTASLRTLATATGIGLVFAGVGFGIEKLISIMGDSIRRNEEFQKSQETSLDSLATQKSTINDLVSEYEKLSNIDRNIGQEERYVELQNQLATLLPHIKQGEDERGNAIIANSEHVREHIELLEEQLAYQQRLSSETAEATITTSESDIGTAEDKIAKYQEKIAKEQEKQQKLIDQGRIDAAGVVSKEIDKWNRKINDQYDIINEGQEKIASAFQATAQQIINVNEIDLSEDDVSWIGQMAEDARMSKPEIEELSNQVSELRDKLSTEISLQGLSSEQVGIISSMTTNLEYGAIEWDKYRDALQATGIDSDRLTNILGYLRNSEDELAESAKDAEVDIRTMSPTFNELGEIIGWVNGQIDDSTDMMDENGEAIKDWSERISEAKDNFSELAKIAVEMAKAGELDQAATLMQKDAYEALSNEVSPLNGLLETLAEGKALSAAEAMELINKEEALAEAISFENGVIKVNEDAVKKLRDQKVAGYTDMQKSVIAEAQQTAVATAQNLKNYGIEIQAIQTLADAKARVAQLELERRKSFAKDYTDEMGLLPNDALNRSMGRIVREEIDTTIDNFEGVIDLQKQVESLSGMIESGLTQVGTSAEKMSSSSDKAKKSAKDSKASLEESTFVADAYARVLEELNSKIAILNNLHNDQAKHSKSYRDSLQKEIKLLQQKQKLLEQQAKSLRSQIKSGNIAQYGILTDSTEVTLPSSGSAQSSKVASGGSNSATIWNFFKSKGFTDNVVAGIMGNLQLESGLSPTALNKSSGAFGIAQWLGSRKSSLQNYARSTGGNMNSLSTQLNFLWNELNGSEKRTMNWLQSNQGASASTVAHMFDKLFERSEGTHVPQRQKYANNFLNQYAGSGGSYQASSDVTDAAKDRINAQNEASRAEAQRQQAVFQAESDLLGLNQEISGINDLIEDLRYQILESHLAEFDWLKKKLTDDLSRIDYQQLLAGDGTTKWMKLQLEREEILKKQRGHDQDALKFLKNQLKTNKDLTKAQKARLDEEIIDRTNQLWDMEQEILNARLEMADQIIETYNEALRIQKDASVKAIDDLIEAIDKELNEADWNKKLRDQQKERQEILDEMTSLAIDDSDSAKKRKAELEKLLQEADQSLDDMLTERETDLRKESLTNERDEIESHYDDLINDEKRLAKMRTDIVNGSTRQIQKDLRNFQKDFAKNAGDIGKSVVNNILSSINSANTYLGGAKAVKTASFDTGGWYTGSFSGGIPATLHEKELVLNKQDTSNLLKTIDWTRGLVRDMNSLNSPSFATGSSGVGSNDLTVVFNIDKVEGGKAGADDLIGRSIEGFEKLGFKFKG